MYKRFIAGLAAGLLIMAPVGQSVLADERTVTVRAEGSVGVKPDIATIRLGVTTVSDTAKQALAENSQAMTRVIAALKRAGVADKDLRTTAVNVRPRYSGGYSSRSKTAGKRAIIGYFVTNRVHVLHRTIATLGGLLDAAVAAGANQMHGISFGVSNAELLRDTARKNAMANAFRRGGLYARAARAKLGPVLKVSEQVGFGPRPHTISGRAASSMAVPIQSGEQRIRAVVTVVFGLE